MGTIIPNLLDYPGPVVCIDPKGENARITARHRARLGPVHVLDPFRVTGIGSAAFNPLDRIDPAGLDLADDCMTLADALVYDAPGEAGEAHWNEEARALISGIILSIVTSEPASTRNVATLRDHLTLAPQTFAAQLADMQAQGGLAALRRQPPPWQVRSRSRRRTVGRAAPYPFSRQPAHEGGAGTFRFHLRRSEGARHYRLPGAAA